MKRSNYLLNQAIEPDNLRLAFWKAQRGKSYKRSVQRYRNELDKNLCRLREEIIEGKVNVGAYSTFKVYIPKERQIFAPPFSDQVLHHALMNVCHDNFDRYQIADSYACRIGKGTFAALDRAKSFQRRYSWFLKLDIRKYFDSIRHNTLKTLLERRFKEEKLLSIFAQIIDTYTLSDEYVGLPIGNLTSQYFANHYLATADRYAKEVLRIPAYVRYMDDIVMWGNCKSELLAQGRQLEAFLADRLQLGLKHFFLNSTKRGLPFLGYLLYPSHTRLTRSSRKRFTSKMKLYSRYLQEDSWTQEEYARHVLPLIAFIRYADTYNFRTKLIMSE